MAPDGTDQRQITSELSNYQMHPVASPDGRILVYERWDQNPLTGSLANVKIANANGTNATELRGGTERSPSFSPDGTRIALVQTEGLILVDPDGSNEVQVRPWFVTQSVNRPIVSPQAWSPNGQFIVISQQPNLGLGNPQEIWAISVADGSAQRLIAPPSQHPSVSVTGWIAFSSDIDGNYNVFVADPTGAVTRLTSSTASDDKPVWSPDGSKLIFVSNRDGNSEIYIMNRDGTGLANLTRHPANQTDPYWVP